MAPLRADVNPTDFADLLPQVFILGHLAPGRYAFRLSGGQLERLYGRSLRHDDFASLWRAGDRVGLQTAMEAALRRGTALVVDAQGEAGAGESADFEILLAPMISASGAADRFLGLWQPLSPLAAPGDSPLGPMRARGVRAAVQDDSAIQALPRLKLAAVGGRRLG